MLKKTKRECREFWIRERNQRQRQDRKRRKEEKNTGGKMRQKIRKKSTNNKDEKRKNMENKKKKIFENMTKTLRKWEMRIKRAKLNVKTIKKIIRKRRTTAWHLTKNRKALTLATAPFIPREVTQSTTTTRIKWEKEHL